MRYGEGREGEDWERRNAISGLGTEREGEVVKVQREGEDRKGKTWIRREEK